LIARKLTDEDRDSFYNFLKQEKILNTEKGRPWFIDCNVNDIEDIAFNEDKRQIFGTFKDNELVAVLACRLWTSMPFTTFDTFVVSKTLGYKAARDAVTPMKLEALKWGEQHGRVVHLYIGPLKESRLMASKKGLWTKAIKEMNYIPTEIGIVPANTDPENRFIRTMMFWEVYPVDMLVFMLVKDLNKIPDNWDRMITLK
jgi:hypothetical protein